MAERQRPSSFNTNSISWLLQRASAVILILLLAGHMLQQHFLNHPYELTFMQTQVRMQELWYFSAMWLFLIVGAFHGLNGVYQALIGFGVEGRKRTIAKWGLIFAGTVLIIQGTRVALAMAGGGIP